MDIYIYTYFFIRSETQFATLGHDKMTAAFIYIYIYNVFIYLAFLYRNQPIYDIHSHFCATLN